MIAACGICGQLVTSRGFQVQVDPEFELVPDELLQLIPDELRQQARLDQLASVMVEHIFTHHRGKESNELAAVANLCSKVYAMRLAQSSEPDFDNVRASWKLTIQKAVFETQEAAAPAGVSSSSSSPSGS